MKTLDRLLVASLMTGVWLLVAVILLKPTTSISHPDPEDCSGYGEIEELRVGGSVYVYSLSC